MEIALDVKPFGELTEDKFLALCQSNGDVCIERDAEGGIRIAPPTGEDVAMETVLDGEPFVSLTEDEFFEFCQRTQDVRIERNAKGEILIMLPAGGATGNRNIEIAMQLQWWSKRDGTGIAFDSSGGFRLPNQATRSPDASWIPRWRYDQLTEREQERFLPLCPDFAIELKSPSDSLAALKRKMDEYIANGLQLGWLIDPKRKTVHIYRPPLPVEVLDNPNTLSADPILPGFVLDLTEIW